METPVQCGVAATVASTRVALYYKYVAIAEPTAVAEEQRGWCEQLALRGRVLVAHEGINGTLQGSEQAIAAYVARMDATALFQGIHWKMSNPPVHGTGELFPDLCIKEVREIVGTGFNVPLDVAGGGAKHLAPEDFHRVLEETPPEELFVVDVRNDYEYAIGHFDGAVNPGMHHTAQWPSFVKTHTKEIASKKVMMYCTGGIRCEKTSAYLRHCVPRAEVYQLFGGIHNYLECFPDGGRFSGVNFVFDKRMQQADVPAAAADDGEGVAPAAAAGVGSCTECQAPWPRLDGGRVCTVCRGMVLVCDRCDGEGFGDYYCTTHQAWRGVYYHFLDRFSDEELRVQRAGLERALAQLAALPGTRKNRRATLLKKMREIDERLTTGCQPVDATRRCRCCAAPYTGCRGRCWGFWREQPPAAALAEESLEATAAGEPLAEV